MRVCFVSSEVFPFSKTGGLADVAGSFPKALSKNGVDVFVFSPKYAFSRDFDLKKIGERKVYIGERVENYTLYEYSTDSVIYYFIGNDFYFERDDLYMDENGDFNDNAERFSLFCAAVLDAITYLNIYPNIIHTNDWQSALVNIYFKLFYRNYTLFEKTKIIFTIHNVGYQGIFDKTKLKILNLNWDLFTIDYIEFYDKINLLKGGVVFADFVNTVSKTYAREIQTQEYGYGLEGLFYKNRYKITGVLNGIDYSIWDPKHDPFLNFNYDTNNIEIKKENKKVLQQRFNLRLVNMPLFGSVMRLVEQKGIDILIKALDYCLVFNIDAQFIILGSGEKLYESQLLDLSERYKEKFIFIKGFDEDLAHKIYGSCDFFMIPSRYEPCGLSQMISFRYGTIPIVRATGGLKDSVSEININQRQGSGIVFYDYTHHVLIDALYMAYDIFSTHYDEFLYFRKNIMDLNFSWDKSAKEYVKLYETLTKD